MAVKDKELQMVSTDLEKIKGCLLGGAVGDALGAPVEFLSLGEIQRKFGEKGIADYYPTYDRNGAITDDTQMTLFTVEGILRKGVGDYFDSSTSFVDCTRYSYIRWLGTQGIKWINKDTEFIYNGILWHRDELHERRGPGKTCLDSLQIHLESIKKGVFTSPQINNNSKGCGGVMRVSPVGLFSYFDEPFEEGCKSAKLTHSHPSGYLAAGFLAKLIRLLFESVPLRKAVEITADELKKFTGHEECLDAVTGALSFAENFEITPENVEKLGAGWVAEETLAISLFCSLKAESFIDGVRSAVNHGGDSDSTGSVTGSILGVINGKSNIPDEFTKELELHDFMEDLAEDLYAFSISPSQKSDKYWLERYPV
jgi:ADP-ribosyl-[dinitrogen reductase] hydrolase